MYVVLLVQKELITIRIMAVHMETWKNWERFSLIVRRELGSVEAICNGQNNINQI